MENKNNSKGSQTPPEPRQWPAWLRLHGPAVYLALIYLLVGLLWIFGTDYLLSYLPRSYRTLETTKGALFVLVTAWLLYSVLQRNARLKLAAVERHYDHLVRYANDIYLLADEHYRIVEANERAVEAYGYPRGELIGLSVRDLRAADYRDRLEEDFSKHVASGSLYEIRQLRKDGTTFPVEVSAHLIEVEGRRYFQGIIRDISERKQAEEALARSRQHFMSLLDSISDPAWLKDADSRILAANRAYARAVGLSVQDMAGKSDADLWPDEIAARHRAADKEVMSSRAPVRLDELLPTAAGERWFEIIKTPVFDPAGAVVGTTGIARDVTERREAEKLIADSRQRLRALLDGIPDVAWMKDRAGRYTAYNKAFALRAGKSGAEIIGRKAEEVWPAPYRRCFYDDDSEVLNSGKTVQMESSVGQGADECWTLVTRAPIIDAEGKVTGLAGLARDITERKQAENRMRFMNSLLATQQEVLPDGVLLVDEKARILNINRLFVDLFGIPDELVAAGDDDPVLQWCLDRMCDPEAELARIRHLYAQRGEKARDELRMTDGRIIERHTAPVIGTGGVYYGRVWHFRDITGERKAQQALEESENRYRKLVELTPDTVTVVSADGKVISANPASLNMFGYDSLEQVVGRDIYQFVPAEHRQQFQSNLAELMRLGSLHGVESLYQRRDGSRFFAEVSSALTPALQPGQPPMMTAIIRDISERKMQETQLLAVNRALRVLSECNGHLVRASEESELLGAICKTLTTTGGYRLALVAYEEAGALVKKQETSGDGESPCDVAWETITRTTQPDAAAWRALDTGDTVRILRDDADMDCQRHDSPFNKGVSAILVLPLKDGAHAFGVLTIYADRPDAFSAAEVKLLEELAGDLAFGIRGIRIRKARDEAMQSLNASETKLKTVVENTSDGIVMIDQAGIILFANVGAEKLLARPIASLVGSEFDIPLTGDVPFEHVIHDGSTATLELTVADTEWQGKPARIVALHDVTARRQVEIQRQAHAAQLQQTLIQTIEAMALTVEKRDPYTAGHQARVADLAVAIGREMNLPEMQLDGLRLGALIHDIGKIYIPAEILNRPGRLGEHEIGLIRTHPQVGFDIVKNVDFIWPVKEIIVQHHERMDGSGYPAGLKGDRITLEARIVGVADVVEAMASHRPYRPSLGVERGLEEIRNGSGSHYDSLVVAACLRLFEEKRFAFDFGQHQGNVPSAT